jgi:AraC-like DNA-binding protein
MTVGIPTRRGAAHDQVLQRYLFHDDELVVGEFIWNARQVGERRRSVTGARGYLIVIPWSPVRITHDGGRTIVAEPRTAVFYEPRQPYAAEQLVTRPERSYFIGLSQATMGECLRDDLEKLPFTHGPCDDQAFLAQRRLVMYLLKRAGAAEAPEPLAVQEAALNLSAHLLRAAGRARTAARRGPSPGSRTLRRRRECALAAQELLLRRYREPLSLPAIASAVGVSPFHLCRAFRAVVGESIHQYRTDLRLRAALEPLCESNFSLAHLALDLGFSSQSHFTTAFSARFGITPAALRRDVGAASTILKDRRLATA